MGDWRAVDWERWGARYVRFAVGAAFLSAVAGRFGLWSGHINPDNFARFIQRTAELNAFMPASTMPLLAWAATAVETSLGVALIVGVQVRWAAFGSAVLLAWFGTAMAVSAGLKSPLDYSVFSASAGALLLALHETRTRPPGVARSAAIRGR
jgi:putative oxidoreductase